MTILDILEEKRKALSQSGNPLDVPFTVEELNTIGDIKNLRNLKLVLSIPRDFTVSSDIFMCTKKILDGEGPVRVLEFCVMANPCLRTAVTSVFGKVFS